MSLSAELIRHSRQIELNSKRLVHSAFMGAYHSAYKGHGLMFKGVRPYVAGDDIRHIDWKVTARAGKPYVKEYVEERELTLLVVIDASASLLFGTEERSKRDLAAELSAVLAYSAISNQDKAGVLLFSEQVERYIPPAKGQDHVLGIIHQLLTFEPKQQGTHLGMALRTVNRVLRRGAIVVIVSDFLMTTDDYWRELTVTGERHETLAVVVGDPMEDAIPQVGLLGLEDAERGGVAWVDTSQRGWQEAFLQKRQQERDLRDATLRRAGVDRIDITMERDYVRALARYFREKAQRR
jgi:uncharacterized protein (DUF58 family)